MSSRRSRRRRGAGAKSGGRAAVWVWVGLGLLVVLIAAMGGGYFWLKSWLHSEAFRTMLGSRASEALAAEAAFGEFRWDGTGVECRSFEARDGAVVDLLEARGLSMDIGLERLGDRLLLLHHARVESLAATLDLRDRPREVAPVPDRPPVPRAAKPEGWWQRLVPNAVELTGLRVARSALRARIEAGEIRLDEVAWEIEPAEAAGAYEAVARGGRLHFPWEWMPEVRLDEARLRYQDGHVFILGSEFRLYERGHATLAGEVGGEALALDLSVQDITAAEIVPEDWRQRLDGRVEADLGVVTEDGDPVVRGSLRLLDGVLTGLPVLDALGAYGGNPRFRRLTLSEATTDFEWADGTLVIRGLRLGSEGLVRLQGDLRVGADRSLSGIVNLGLMPGTLASIPGAETEVFLPGPDRLLWTPVRISGTLDDPEEDLTRRLIEAAGWRMIERLPETGERVFKYTRKAVDPQLLEPLTGAGGVLEKGRSVIDSGRRLLDGEGGLVDEAEKVIRDGKDVVREVEGILRFFDDRGDPPRGSE